MNRSALLIRNCLLVTKPYRHYCSKVKEHEPIKFSTSMAARPGVASVVRSPQVTTPWYQPYVVCGSVAVFLIYFCILREENDIDSEFDKTLYERLSGLEKTQLIQSYKFNKEHGKDTTDIERRLKEIEIEEAKEARAV